MVGAERSFDKMSGSINQHPFPEKLNYPKVEDSISQNAH